MTSLRIAIIGLTHQGILTAKLLATKYAVVVYDPDETLIELVKKGVDPNNEVNPEDLKSVIRNYNPSILPALANDGMKDYGLYCTSRSDDLFNCNFYIITLPEKIGDQQYLISSMKNAARVVAKYISRGDAVILKNEPYPNAGRTQCLPIIEQFSGLKNEVDFLF
jgi:UDP-N-acetyl-D-galactosamine dehydrogenase